MRFDKERIMDIIGRVGGTSTVNNQTQAQKTQYTPPPRQKDADTQRFTAQTQARAQPPAVHVTLSPEAQKALAAQKSQSTSSSGASGG
jgi:hypothetical protein